MKKTVQKLKFHLSDRTFLASLAVGVLFFALSMGVNYIAGNYATEKASNAVTDIFLDNLPVVDVGPFFIWGSVALLVFIVIIAIRDPKIMPFLLKSAALFYFIRSLFISLTHIGPSPAHIFIESNRVFEKFIFGGDLFFSGHTGLPFLFALMFWENKYLRLFFLICSVVFGVSVLLGHLHYSIDVFSAFFITFGIFHLAKYFFKKDYDLFKS